MRFGVFEIDLAAAEVRKGGMRQKLACQPFQVLQALLERPGEIVTREELRERIWPHNTFVDYELALKKDVSRVREVLGDLPENPRYIETVPRRGYRFIGVIGDFPSLSSSPESSRNGPVVAAGLMEQPKAKSPAGPNLHWKLAAGFALVVSAAMLLWFNVGPLRTRIFARSSSAELRSIAVLPLQNLSNDPDQEYFSDGITDELTTNLAKIGELRVISRTSAMTYKKTNKTLPEIAHELDVDVIVEGSVQRSGNRVRVTAQLINARADRHLWAESYERNINDILALQDELARDIAAEVRVNLTPQEHSRLRSEKAINSSAYDAYLRGRYFWAQRNAEAIDKAKSYFKQALREDPTFAPAYSGLSDCYWVGWGAKIDMPLAEQYAQKAIALEPELAEGHASLGISYLNEYQLHDAEKELRRAIELRPGYGMAHHFYAAYLLAVGRAEEALAENERARQLDPFSMAVNTMRMIILIGARKYEQALDQGQKYAEIVPQSPVPHKGMARVYWLEGKALEAISEERKAAALEHSTELQRSMDQLTAIYQKSGLLAAEQGAVQFMESDHEGHYDEMALAFQYGNLKDKTKVFQWLEQSRKVFNGNLFLGLNTAPEFDFLRGDARFQDLLRRLNLAGR